MANNGQNRHPKPIIQSMVLHNLKDEEQQWEPQVFQEGAWVYMQPSATDQPVPIVFKTLISIGREDY